MVNAGVACIRTERPPDALGRFRSGAFVPEMRASR